VSTVVRKFIAVPARPSHETWEKITAMLAPSSNSDAHSELMRVAGIATSLIAREAIKSSAIVVYGGPGPRVKIYCLYGQDAISGDSANESALATVPTQDDWKMSLPCPKEDLSWVTEALAEKSTRITAREQSKHAPDEENNTDESEEESNFGQNINLEAFLRR